MGNTAGAYSVNKKPTQKSLVMRRARRNTVFDAGMLTKKMTSTGSNLAKYAAAAAAGRVGGKQRDSTDQDSANQPDGPVCHWLQHSTKIPVLGCDTCVLGGFDAAGIHSHSSCQDRAYFSFPKFDKRSKAGKKVQFPGYVLVLDGHGKDGEGVAAYCEKFIAKEIEGAGRALVKDATEEVVVGFIRKTFEKCQNEMKDCADILPELSGTTASLVLLTRQYMCTAGVGDSKGVLVCSNENRLSPIVLQEVHNLASTSVKERIEKAGGRVEPMSNNVGKYVGPPRVWLKDSNSPGLVMSRSLGDTVAHGIGVTAEPEVYFRELDGTEMFLVGLLHLRENAGCSLALLPPAPPPPPPAPAHTSPLLL